MVWFSELSHSDNCRGRIRMTGLRLGIDLKRGVISFKVSGEEKEKKKKEEKRNCTKEKKVLDVCLLQLTTC